jgi:hypothetical protein
MLVASIKGTITYGHQEGQKNKNQTIHTCELPGHSAYHPVDQSFSSQSVLQVHNIKIPALFSAAGYIITRNCYK